MAAIIALLNALINLLSSEPYVIVISLDFPKAFDTVRHSSLLHKPAQLDFPDYIYNHRCKKNVQIKIETVKNVTKIQKKTFVNVIKNVTSS